MFYYHRQIKNRTKKKSPSFPDFESLLSYSLFIVLCLDDDDDDGTNISEWFKNRTMDSAGRHLNMKPITDLSYHHKGCLIIKQPICSTGWSRIQSTFGVFELVLQYISVSAGCLLECQSESSILRLKISHFPRIFSTVKNALHQNHNFVKFPF